MKTSLAFLLVILISPMIYADWGDVYYCQMTTFSTTTLEGKRTDHKLEKFQFKLDKSKKAMVFVKSAYFKSGYFSNAVMELREEMNWPSQEAWNAKDKFGLSYFEEGKCLYSMTGYQYITSITGDCDKF